MKTFCGFLNMFDNIPDFVIPVFTSGNNFYYQTYNDKDDIQYFKLKQNPRLYNGIALSIVGGFIYNGKMLKSNCISSIKNKRNLQNIPICGIMYSDEIIWGKLIDFYYYVKANMKDNSNDLFREQINDFIESEQYYIYNYPKLNVLNSMGELHECVGDYICPAYALSDKKRFCSMIKKITDEYLDYCDNRGIIIGLDNKPKSLDYFYNYLRNFNWERLNQSEISYLLFMLNKFSTDNKRHNEYTGIYDVLKEIYKD